MAATQPGPSITVTPAAAQKIREAAAGAGAQEPVLRVAVQRLADGSLDYGMGFDQSRPGDATLATEGIVLLVAPQSQELIAGTTIDYVEIEPGDFRFIFVPPGGPAAT